MGARTAAILHADLDAFYASVEQLLDPSLRNKPMAVGTGVVLAASYEAKAFGVSGGMSTRRAKELCPHLLMVAGHFSEYQRLGDAAIDIMKDFTPLVERISIDEAFLDVAGSTHLLGSPTDMAVAIRKRVRDELGLPVSVGIARTKHLAKIASQVAKPDGLLFVPAERELEFLHPLPVELMWGVGPVTARQLAEIGVTTVGGLAQLPEQDLCTRFGRHGAEMARQARGIDHRPVITEHERKSVSQERTFSRDLNNAQSLKRQLWRLSQGVARRLRQAEMVAGTVAIKLRYADFTTLTRQMSLAVPTDDERMIYRAALVLLRRAWQRGRPVRLLGVAGRHLAPPPGQLPLF